MGFVYLIDKQGGSHYHREGCVMTTDPRFNYERIFRDRERTNIPIYRLTRVRESGKYYYPCPACFEAWFRR